MPYYTFTNNKTGEELVDQFMTITERDTFLKDNPDFVQSVTGAPMIGYSTVARKPDSNFRDVLKNIKSKHRRSTINTW